MKWIKSHNLGVLLILILCSFLFWNRILLSHQILWVGDITRQYFPWYQAMHDSVHGGRLPLWEERMGGGYPLFAQGEVGVFYPLNWILTSLLSSVVGFNLSFFIHSLIASVGMYLYCRLFKLSSAASLFAALTFTYGFFFTARFIHTSIIASSSFLPWGLFIIEKIVTNKKMKMIFFLSLIIFLQIVSGHPQITFISSIVYALYGLLRLWPSSKRGVFLIIFAISLGFFLSAVQLIPTWKLTHYSSRQNSPTFIFSYSLPGSQFITFLFPYLFGLTPADSNAGYLQFGGHYWEFGLYIGVTAFLLAGIGIFSSKAVAKSLFILVIVFSLFALGGYLAPYRFVVRVLHLPFRVSARFLLPVTFFMSTLSGFGFETLIYKKIRRAEKIILVSLLFILGVLVIFGTLTHTNPGIFFVKPITIFLQKFIFIQYQPLTISMFNLSNTRISLPFIFIAIFLLLISAYNQKLISQTGVIILLFGLFFCDSFLQGYLYQQLRDVDEVLTPPEIIQKLPDIHIASIITQTEPGPYLLEKNSLQPNLNLLWNVHSLNVVTPLPLVHQTELENESHHNLVQIAKKENAGYIFSQSEINDKDFKLILHNQYIYIYKNMAISSTNNMMYDDLRKEFIDSLKVGLVISGISFLVFILLLKQNIFL